MSTAPNLLKLQAAGKEPEEQPAPSINAWILDYLDFRQSEFERGIGGRLDALRR